MKRFLIVFLCALTAGALLCVWRPWDKPGDEESGEAARRPVGPAEFQSMLEEGELTTGMFGQPERGFPTYSDGTYYYYYQEATGQVFGITLTPERAQSVLKQPDDEMVQSISTEEADQILRETVAAIFPEYNQQRLKITAEYDTGATLECFRYKIKEEEGETCYNTAEATLTYSGQVMSIYGTRNTEEDFLVPEDSLGPKTSEEALDAVFAYLKEKQEELEDTFGVQAANTAAEFGISTDDLPEYRLILDSANSLRTLESYRTLRDGRVVWEVSCEINSTWAQYDTVFAPVITAYVDAVDGSVAKVLYP